MGLLLLGVDAWCIKARYMLVKGVWEHVLIHTIDIN